MAVMYEYKCTKCSKKQVKWHKMSEKNEEPCEHCKASADNLVKLLAAVRPHGSWRVT